MISKSTVTSRSDRPVGVTLSFVKGRVPKIESEVMVFDQRSEAEKLAKTEFIFHR